MALVISEQEMLKFSTKIPIKKFKVMINKNVLYFDHYFIHNYLYFINCISKIHKKINKSLVNLLIIKFKEKK